MFVLHRKWIERQDERALTCQFICHRRLFGHIYQDWLPDYFGAMPRGSGVYLLPCVPTHLLVPGASRPGDIDLLIVPYEGRDLVLDQVMAVEIKAIRARFDDQGRSPNEFGFTQAGALLDLGFPHAGVLHLVTSDNSPPLERRALLRMRMLEGDRVEEEGMVLVDTLPTKLIDRVFGRLVARSPNPMLGLAAADLEEPSKARNGLWLPSARAATRNSNISHELLRNVASLVERNATKLFATSRFDPEPGEVQANLAPSLIWVGSGSIWI